MAYVSKTQLINRIIDKYIDRFMPNGHAGYEQRIQQLRIGLNTMTVVLLKAYYKLVSEVR